MKTKDDSDFKTKKYHQSSGLEKMSSVVTKASGSSTAFIIALLTIIVWIITGPIFNYSDTWQLVINTGTTIITFLMVFLIQRSQNKDSIALHLKLNELVIAEKMASNRLVSVEEISETDLKILQQFYSHLAKLAEEEISINESHSLDKANTNHRNKTLSKGGNAAPKAITKTKKTKSNLKDKNK